MNLGGGKRERAQLELGAAKCSTFLALDPSNMCKCTGILPRS